jgi:hypothetical protein
MIFLFCVSLLTVYGCDDTSVNPNKEGEQSQGPGDGDGME